MSEYLYAGSREGVVGAIDKPLPSGTRTKQLPDGVLSMRKESRQRTPGSDLCRAARQPSCGNRSERPGKDNEKPQLMLGYFTFLYIAKAQAPVCVKL